MVLLLFWCYTRNSSIFLSKSFDENTKSFSKFAEIIQNFEKKIYFNQILQVTSFLPRLTPNRGVSTPLRFAPLRSTPARVCVDGGKNDVKIVII